MHRDTTTRRLPPRRPPARGGFTLIELLIVVSILAVLSAFTLAAIGRVRSAQNSKNTELVLGKIQKALDQQRNAIADQVKDDKRQGRIPAALLNFCDGDPDRAESLWAYMNFKRELPQTFAEACSPVTIPGIASLPARQTFAAASGVSGAAELEAAALLYLVVAEKGNRGAVADSDLASSKMEVTIGTKTFTVFKDAWGMPITYLRFAENPELNNPPFSKQTVGAGETRDPLDPRDKLRGWTNTTNKNTAQSALGVVFNGNNKMTTCISAGPNKTAEWNNWLNSDDLFAVRLNRQGNRGD